MSDERQYFNFPVQLLKGIFKDKQGVLNSILYFALYAHSLKINNGERFLRTEVNTDLKDFLTSAKYFNVTLGDGKNAYNKGRELFNSIPNDSPTTGLNTSIFWDFYKNHKSDLEIACLLAFLAIRSILGMKSYCKITNAYLWARMDGKSKTIEDVSELSPDVARYAKEYQTKKIKETLRNDWGLKYYSYHTRGFYVSFDLELGKLVFEAEKRKKKSKDNDYKRREREAREKALRILNNKF